MFFVSSVVLDSTTSIGILPYFHSDHSYVFLTFFLPDTPSRSPGVWKFNTFHLKSDALFTGIKSFWTEWRKEKPFYPSLTVWWDAGKKFLKVLLRAHSQNQAQLRRSRSKALHDELVYLQQRFDLGEDISYELATVRSELDDLYRYSAAGAKLRAKEKCAEDGDSSSKYFFQKERSRGVPNIITGIRNPQGRVVRSIQAILRVWVFFYVNLFLASRVVPEDSNFLLNGLKHRLSATESASCEGLVTLEECTKALQTFKNNKFPGIDGLPY